MCSSSMTIRKSATSSPASCSSRGFASPPLADAEGAKASLRGLAFDVILLDVMLPGQSGLDLAREIKSTSHIPICMLTARAEADQRIEGLECGVEDYILEALRAARAAPAPEATSCGGASHPPSATSDEVRMGRIRLPHRAGRAEAPRRDREAHRARARPPTPVRPEARHADSSATSSRATIRREASAPSTCRSTGLRRKIETDPSNPVYLQTVRGKGYILYTGLSRHLPGRSRRSAMLECIERRSMPSSPRARSLLAMARRECHARGCHLVADLLPKGLYARALIIIIAPIVVLEGVIAFVFMERHWQNVTRRLSESTARDIAALIDIYEADADGERARTASSRWRADGSTCRCRSCRPAIFPRCAPSRSSISSTARSRARSRATSQRPFWIDTVGQSRHVEIRVKLRTRSCASSPRAVRPTPRTRTSSSCGWSARR